MTGVQLHSRTHCCNQYQFSAHCRLWISPWGSHPVRPARTIIGVIANCRATCKNMIWLSLETFCQLHQDPPTHTLSQQKRCCRMLGEGRARELEQKLQDGDRWSRSLWEKPFEGLAGRIYSRILWGMQQFKGFSAPPTITKIPADITFINEFPTRDFQIEKYFAIFFMYQI